MAKENYIVPISQLRNVCNTKDFQFKTTKSLSSEINPIGQERAIEAIETALNIQKKGFNLFLSGEPGCGKSSIIKAILTKKSAEYPAPTDWVYVNNFDNESLPIPISMQPGSGKVFAKDMDHFINDVVLQIPKLYESKQIKDERSSILGEYNNKEGEYEDVLVKKVEEMGFYIAKTEEGYIANPINTTTKEPMTQEDILKLTSEEKKDLERKQKKITEYLDTHYRDILKIEKNVRKKLEKHLKNVVELSITDSLSELLEKYKTAKEIKNYLKSVKDEILNNATHIVALLIDEDFLQIYKKYNTTDDLTKHYRVNVLVNNGKLKGAPVIFENNPTITSLFGSIEYIEDPTLGPVTSFINVKPGKIHLANGGYLVLEAIDLYKNPRLWEMLKRVIRNGEIQIGDDSMIHTTRVSVRIEPQPIPIKIKVILVGAPELYDFFMTYDDGFDRLFKIKADFNSEIPRTLENESKYASFIGSKCSEDNLLHLDKGAVGKIIEYSSKMADDQMMLSTNFSKIVDILIEADYLARSRKKNVISSIEIIDTIDKIEYRLKKEEEIFLRFIKDDIINIDTKNDVVGQINALTVLSSGEYEFGIPARITAKTFVGESGVLNIEREVRMSGQIHDKGIMVLTGYLGSVFGQKRPLSFEAYITFEQQHYHVDGDSASSTELYAILSSLSEISISQRLAVTGAVNQNGDIQPIGGVNQKIEGFFEICKHRGFSKNGILIPKANTRNLMLKDEIVEAIKSGDFTIYAINTIEEGIELLTGVPAGSVDKEGTLFYLADQKLKSIYNTLNENS